MRVRIVYFLIALLTFVACETEQVSASENLAKLIEKVELHKGYDEDLFPLGVFTESYFKSEAEFAENCVEELLALNKEGLSETEQISYELLRFTLQNQVDYYSFEMYLNPILSDSGFHSNLVYKVKTLNNYEEVKAYLSLLKDIPRFVDEHLILLEKGLKKGVSQPKVIFKGYESTYNKHLVKDYKESLFFSPFLKLPDDLSMTQKDSVLEVAPQIINDDVTPQFKRIKQFFETSYIPDTRASLGVSNIPNGEAFYQNRINYYTTSTAYTAKDIHDIGLREVKRIKTEMLTIIESLKFEGSFEDFLFFLRTDDQFYAKSARELLMIARDMAKRADEQLPHYFITLPRKPYGVAPVPEAIAPKYTGGRYLPTEAESAEPAYYWVNTYDLPSRTLYTLPALTVHEAVPGHHLQISLNYELGDRIPSFRRDLYISAYGEGWGLYAEFLANEMGMYTTDYEKFGQLTYEMWRACRLVVDTGIHAFDWSREEVVSYMRENTALSLHEIETETDRYISWPGQALSYKIGELKIRELRKKAELELGSDFDIREFHEIILEEGTVTLPILEERIIQYIEGKTNGKDNI